jgi:hypothetical protein
MTRTATRLALGLLVTVCLGGGALAVWGRPGPLAAGAPGADDDAPAKKGRGKKSGKLDSTAAEPSAAEVARVAPRPPDAHSPPVAAVPAPATPPNVVLVLGCTVRKDQVSPYGAPDDVTPFLGSLARDGVVFDDVIAAAPWTRAASTSILTGFYAVSIGMVDPSQKRDQQVLADSTVTLAEHLQARGYFTLGGSANPNLSADFGFHQGYEVYTADASGAWGHQGGEPVVDDLLSRLRANRQGGDTRPVYLRVMLIDAHSPRDAKAEAFAPFVDDGLPERVAQYRYHLHQLDAVVAHLAEGLEEQGLNSSNTIFVFASDHGEGMNYPRHHGYSHGQYLTPSTNHAVWILRGPGVAAGHRVLGLASQIDIVPTLLGAVGRPLADAGSVEGRDWSALVRGEGDRTAWQRVWTDTWFQESSRAGVYTPTRQCQADFGSSARQNAKGLFVPGCYNRIADPLLTTPIEELALMNDLRAWRAERTAHLASVQTRRAEISEELSRELEVLGYRE